MGDAPLPVSFADVEAEPKAPKPTTTYCCGRLRSSHFCCGRYACTPKRKACCIAAVVLLVAGAIVAIVCGVYFGLYAGRVNLAVGALTGSPLSLAGLGHRRRSLLQTAGLLPTSAQPSATESAYAQVRRSSERSAARARACRAHMPLGQTICQRPRFSGARRVRAAPRCRHVAAARPEPRIRPGSACAPRQALHDMRRSLGCALFAHCACGCRAGGCADAERGVRAPCVGLRWRARPGEHALGRQPQLCSALGRQHGAADRHHRPR